MRTRLVVPLSISGLLLVALATALLLAPASAQPPVKTKRIKLAAYNVEWMLDVFDDPYTEDETRPPKPRKDLELIAQSIRKMNADVVSFEELENEGILRAMVNEYLKDMGYRYVAVQPTNSTRGQNTGIISKFPIVSLTSYRFNDFLLDDKPGKVYHFARDFMQVKLLVSEGKTLDVFVVHLKSKSPNPNAAEEAKDPKSTLYRTAEAEQVRKIIQWLYQGQPDALYAIIGDFNDTPGSVPMVKLLEKDAAGRVDLVDVHAGVKDRGTFLGRVEQGSTIDYILASPALAGQYVRDSAGVFRDGKLNGGSDHAPVYAEFDIKQ